MKKLYYLFCIVCALTICLSSKADVNIRFWDNGILVHTATEVEGRGARSVSQYYTISAPASCDGYNFIGWKVDSPIINETIYANDAASGITSTINIQSADIDLYAVYKKSVTCYSRIGALSDLTDGGKYLFVGYNSGSDSYYAMGNQNIVTSNKYSGVLSSSVAPCTNNKIYSVDGQCVWVVTTHKWGNRTLYTWQNESNTERYIYI